MEFTVNFRTKFGDRIAAPSRSVGLNQLDAARRIFCVPELPPEKVQGYVVPCHIGSNVEVALEMARRSKHFDECNRVEVQIADSKRYHALRPHAAKNNCTGEIILVQFSWEIDEKAILANWEMAGFPLVWGEEEEVEPPY